MPLNSETQFGPIRSILWPIKRKELKIVLPMLLILFMVCFNYSILRNLKDVLVVTAAASGGEIIPFIKVWAMLPMAVLSAFVFTKLTNRYSQEVVYYLMIGGFLLYYALFAFVIYPMGEAVELTRFANYLEGVLPAGYRGMVSMVRHWSFTLFYVMCELWGSIILTVLFWGFANEITKVKDARRFYSIYAVISGFSTVLAGYMGKFFSRIEFNPSLPFGRDAWEQTIIEVVIAVVIVGIGIMVAFWWMNKYILNSDKYSDLHEVRHTAPKIKKKQSLRDSFAYLAQSRYLLCIAVIVVSYNLVINLVEVVWKDQLKMLYPNKGDYFIYLSNVTIILGLLSSCAAFFVGTTIKKIGWTKTALITPMLMLVTSLGFFGFIFIRQFIGDSVTIMGMTPLAIAVFFGSTQNCLSKSAKYSLFDSTKEMAFIPLDHESKLKGKAAIDGVGSRVGKSGGSLVHQGLLIILPTLASATPYLAVILFAVIIAWTAAVKALGIEFGKLANKKHDLSEGITTEEKPVLAKV